MSTLKVTQKLRNVTRGLLQRYGGFRVERWLWNREFSSGRWDYIERTPGDPVYPYLEKYASCGNILDLGCGAGNTANEIDSEAYAEYIGVDVSDVAVAKARARSEMNGRGGKNSFYCADIATFVPPHRFDVILFRESLYYVPKQRIMEVLAQYSMYLREGGCLIVRLWTTRGRCGPVLHIIETAFAVVEKYVTESGSVVIVFRDRRSS